jgi:hypothetical protein
MYSQPWKKKPNMWATFCHFKKSAESQKNHLMGENSPQSGHPDFKALQQSRHGAGLPDGVFSNQKFQIWINFGGPCNR